VVELPSSPELIKINSDEEEMEIKKEEPELKDKEIPFAQQLE